MADVRAVKLDGSISTLSGAKIAAFKKQMRGAVVLAGEQGYDQLREVWNGQIDRKPALIARVAGEDDVVAAVNFARDNELLTSVRGGGHNMPGLAVNNGGLMLDLHGLRNVRVDPVARRAYAEPGPTWFDFDYECQAFGLATPGGAVSHTGIAGLTLGGGVGWLSGRHGLTCDNVISFRVVTADGTVRTASADENPDLYWALRGGGGNFGIVTQFEYQLHPVGMMLGGMILYPFDQAKAFFQGYRDYLPSCPDGLTTFGGLFKLPDGTSVAGGIAAWNGDHAEGQKVLDASFRKFTTPMADLLGPIRYCKLQQLIDQQTEPFRRYYVKSNLMREIKDECIDILIDRYTKVPSPLSMMAFQQFGNGIGRVTPDATAYGHRNEKVEQMTFSAWTDPAGDDENRAWAREVSDSVQPFAHGHYVNQVGLESEEGVDHIKAAFGDNWERLVELKTQYDPMNLFRHNQNIRPK
ncbi:MAG: FAD-binding oxidoreductase [Acidimicrobiia bacterium]|nr:FAD-binding oxidoreductase [Acidimicrobiia bacterium]